MQFASAKVSITQFVLIFLCSVSDAVSGKQYNAVSGKQYEAKSCGFISHLKD